MLVTKTVKVDVKRCYDCPYFDNHPQEASCDMVKELHIISHSVAREAIWEHCPIQKANKEYEESLEDCDECEDGKMIPKWSGKECDKCSNWFCF